MDIQPEALVGRQIRVHWTDDDAWYAGKVTGYLPETGQHKVGCCPAVSCSALKATDVD